MSLRLRRWFAEPVVLLCIVAGLLAFVVQSGELGTADTMHRLQATHWLWTSEPQVFSNEYPEFGLHGRGGKGEVAVAKSSVARSSALPAGFPHAEQKRPLAGTSVPHDEQRDINFTDTVYRVETEQIRGGPNFYP